MQTPWAILLCKFKDDTTTEPYGIQRYKDLFTSSGSGRLNIVDFFRDMSHGNLDLTGSQVFGWYTLDKNRSEYLASGTIAENRANLVAWARAKASEDGPNKADLGQFYSVVVSFNVPTDLFGGSAGAVCDDGRDADGMSSLATALLGQEMGHVYGMDHSKAYGSDEAYMDAWDVMSNRTSNMAPHPYFTDLDVRARPVFRLGPGLNAANMWGRGWLDMSRVWTADDEEFSAPVQLRPLHRRDLPGYLAARVGDYFVEFRVPEIWDAAIGDPVVLVHTYGAASSYIYKGTNGNQGLTAGDKFEYGDLADPLAPMFRIEVASIDAGARTATLNVTRRRDRRRVRGPARGIGTGVFSDGGGLIIVNGKVVRVGPRSPVMHVLEDLAVIEQSEAFSHGPARDMLQQQALMNISQRANTQLQQMHSFRSPAAPLQVSEVQSSELA